MQAVRNAATSACARIAVFLLATVTCASGCRQLETPATGLDSFAVARPLATSASATDDTSARTATVYRIAADDRATVSADDDRFVPTDCNILPPRAPDQALAINGDEGLPRPGNAADNGSRPPATSDAPADGSFHGRFRDIIASTCDDVWHDYGNYYSRSTAVQFAAVLAPAAVFANTNLDANFANWYQSHIRSGDTNRAADFFRPLGDGYYTIPVYVSAKFIGEYFDDVPGMSLVGQFGDRASRALLVGAPPLLAVQYLTGGGRPSDYADQSYWRPFHSSHGASGHAFMGAVPFLTLAGMTDDPLAKCFFYACSPWTGMTRINDNVHYLSQVWLGWWMAYLACESVNMTESQKGPMVVTPLITPEMTGVGVVYEH